MHTRESRPSEGTGITIKGTMLDDNNDILLIVNLEKEPVWNRFRNCTDIVGMESTEPNHEGDAERFEK